MFKRNNKDVLLSVLLTLNIQWNDWIVARQVD